MRIRTIHFSRDCYQKCESDSECDLKDFVRHIIELPDDELEADQHSCDVFYFPNVLEADNLDIVCLVTWDTGEAVVCLKEEYYALLDQWFTAPEALMMRESMEKEMSRYDKKTGQLLLF